MSTQTQSNEKTIAEQSVKIALSKSGKPLTGAQLKKKIQGAKRKETNEARQLLAKDIKGQFYDLKIIEFIFSTKTRVASELFLAKLSEETGKDITIEKVLKLPKRDILDYVTEIEEARGIVRGGINPTEYTNIIARYYRGVKPRVISDKDTLLAIYNQEII